MYQTPHGPATKSWNQIQNELGLARKRAGGVEMSDAEYDAAGKLVVEGSAPPAAIAKTIAARKFAMSAAETTVYARLTRAGKTPAEAIQAIKDARALAGNLGTPSSETVRQRVTDRNRSGDWAKPDPVDEP